MIIYLFFKYITFLTILSICRFCNRILDQRFVFVLLYDFYCPFPKMALQLCVAYYRTLTPFSRRYVGRIDKNKIDLLPFGLFYLFSHLKINTKLFIAYSMIFIVIDTLSHKLASNQNSINADENAKSGNKTKKSIFRFVYRFFGFV